MSLREDDMQTNQTKPRYENLIDNIVLAIGTEVNVFNLIVYLGIV